MMIVNVPTEIIPVWFIEKWLKENAEKNSSLDFYIKEMIKEWRIKDAEIQNKLIT